MRISTIDTSLGLTGRNVETANPGEIEARLEMARLEMLTEIPDATLGTFAVASAGDGAHYILSLVAGTAAGTPGGLPLADLRFVVGYGSNMQAIESSILPSFMAAVAAGYTLYAGAESAGATSGLRFLGVTILQRTGVPPAPPEEPVVVIR